EPYRLRTNDAPAAAADSFSTRINSPHTFPAPGVLANDTDPDGDALTAGLPVRTVSDGARTSGSTTVTSASAAFTAADVNASISGTGIPVGARISAVTDATTVTISSAATSTGTNTTLTITRQAANGTVVMNTDGSFTYTPNTGFSGTDTFTYVADDGGGGTATGTVTMTVAGTNTAPTAGGDSYATNEDTPLTVVAPGVVGNDADADADTLTARLAGRTVTDGATTFGSNLSSATANFTALDVGASVSGSAGIAANTRIATVTSPTTATLSAFVTGQFTNITVTITPQPAQRTATANGSVILNLDGSFTYTPAVNYNGSDSFTYLADDGYGLTATATVTISIAAVNDAPVAGPDTYTTNASDPPLVVAAPGVLANDTDAEGAALTASSASTPA
ncbi:MAG: tandem-95 repeat protein, partial [Actinobacteria bacterium]|nr:tandem-95 repeat protein [Actinomycetota bacterium]